MALCYLAGLLVEKAIGPISPLKKGLLTGMV
jgi:hypothetical protein